MEYLFNGAIATIVTVVIAAIFAAVLRRILGSQPARWRSFIVALLAISVLGEVALPLTTAVGWPAQGTPTLNQALLWLLVMAIAVVGIFVAALGLLVIGEAILPTGRFGGFLDIARSTVRGIKRFGRYLQLGWIALTSGLWWRIGQGPESAGFADALVRTLNRAGPTFVKIGQVLSTRTELVGTELTTALARLQADVPPIASDVVVREITTAWGRTPDVALARFDRTPLAAASLAQVHTGTLADGTEIVVKVRRPGADQRVRVDCDILIRFARNAEQRWAWARRLGIAALADGLSTSLLGELDYRREAANMRAGAAVLAVDPTFAVPRVIDELSGDRVLVMTRLDGRSAAPAASDLPASEREALAHALVRRVALTVFADGVFHADLHPGNILLLDDRTNGQASIGILDFGAIGVIDLETRRLLAMLLLAVLSGDNLAATTALTLAFDVDDTHPRSALQRDLGRLMTLHLAAEPDIDALVADLFTLLGRYGISVPGDVAGAFRTIASLQGTLAALDPSMDYLAALRGVLPELVRRTLDPAVLAQQAAVESALAVTIARRLPERVERITDQLANGRLTVRTRAFADADDRAWAGNVATDAISGVIAAVLLGISAWLLSAPDSPVLGGSLTLYPVLGVVAGIAGAALSFRLLVRLFRR